MALGTLPPKSDNSIWSAADQIPALPIVEAAGVDVLGHLGGVRLGKGLQGGEPGEKGRCDLIDPCVSTLSRETDREQ